MGLDMYLYAEKYVSGYDNANSAKISAGVKKLARQAGLRTSDLKFSGFGSAVIRITVGYWRKANAIHNWFVQNVQDGEDNCRPYYVDTEKLKELRDECQAALADKDNTDILPPAAGFFFGSTERDEYYYEDLKTTIKIIDNILNNDRFKGLEIYYRASW